MVHSMPILWKISIQLLRGSKWAPRGMLLPKRAIRGLNLSFMIFTTVLLNSTLAVRSNGIEHAYLTKNINFADFEVVSSGSRGWQRCANGINWTYS